MTIMDTQLNTWRLLEHAPLHFGDVEIVTQVTGDDIHRYTYADMFRRVNQLMFALDHLGLDHGARVATLAWNSYQHLECYFAVPCTGRILHTLNARLSPEDLVYIINDAEDQVIFAAAPLVPVLERIADQIPTVRKVIVFGGSLPESSALPLEDYDALLERFDGSYPATDIDEQLPAAMCYTSGTTGRPKGAVYTHRSTFLHAMGAALGAGMNIGPSDCVVPVVPMFHANAWGMVYAAVSVGAKIVFAQGNFDPSSFVRLLKDEEVTLAAGVPTIWIAVAEELSRTKTTLPDLREVVCGGSQPPRPLIERYRDEFGIPIVQAWGMTETSPLATVARPKHAMRHLPPEVRTTMVETQGGVPLPGISISLRDVNGSEVPFDGTTMGNLFVRGAWVIDEYFKGRSPESFGTDGWFQTGDVAIGNTEGYFTIADRTKDLIKSGGEWISSVEMESAIMSLDGVLEAAVVAVPDPKWQERPLACVVVREGQSLTLEELHEHLLHRGFAKWQLPDAMELVPEIPRTSVGKFDKKVLRSKFGGS
jgi:fatty-acyl-CoA synthase